MRHPAYGVLLQQPMLTQIPHRKKEDVVAPNWLTLEAPSVVFEGDSIDLMCQKKKDWWKIQTVVYYRDGKQLQFPDKVSSVSIPRAAPRDSGQYSCSATARKYFLPRSKSSRSVGIEVLELFPRPVLTVSSYRPTEGSPVTLTCETRPSPQRSNVQLQFCFFRDGKALGSGWSSSPELRVPAMWTEDSGSYWCQAETAALTVRKQSLQSQIHVQSKYPRGSQRGESGSFTPGPSSFGFSCNSCPCGKWDVS